MLDSIEFLQKQLDISEMRLFDDDEPWRKGLAWDEQVCRILSHLYLISNWLSTCTCNA